MNWIEIISYKKCIKPCVGAEECKDATCRVIELIQDLPTNGCEQSPCIIFQKMSANERCLFDPACEKASIGWKLRQNEKNGELV